MNKIFTLAMLSLATVSLISGCATKSENIAATYTPASRFSGMTCQQLSVEAASMNRALSQLSTAQDKRASADAGMVAVGVVLFWPALLATSGTLGPDDNAADIARLKGEAQAMDTAWRLNGCAQQPTTPTQLVPAPRARA